MLYACFVFHVLKGWSKSMFTPLLDAWGGPPCFGAALAAAAESGGRLGSCPGGLRRSCWCHTNVSCFQHERAIVSIIWTIMNLYFFILLLLITIMIIIYYDILLSLVHSDAFWGASIWNGKFKGPFAGAGSVNLLDKGNTMAFLFAMLAYCLGCLCSILSLFDRSNRICCLFFVGAHRPCETKQK